MEFTGFHHEDFDVFQIDGFEERMNALKTIIRPKLEKLGSHFAPALTVLTGEEMFPHVAKHARRTVNPPNDTWVAFSTNSRGYKMLPHLQIGLWQTHIFIWFAIIYETKNKTEMGKILEANLDKIYAETDESFVWSQDHTKPEAIKHSQLTKEDLNALFQRLQTVKKAEILCGYHIPREEAVSMTPEQFLKKAETVLEQLIKLYKLIQNPRYPF